MAGMNGTAINGTGVNATSRSPIGWGLFSRLARAQYGALTHLRWRIFVNGLRSKVGAFEFGARTLSYFVYGLMGLGLAFGAGGMAYGLVADQQWQYLPLVFWFVLLTWQVVPVMLASFQEQFDLGTLLRFPVSFRSFYLLYVVFGLSDVSTAIGALCCLGMLTGITAVRPDLFVFTAIVLLIFAAFNILLVRAIFAWIDRWLSQRKTREILAAFFMIFFLSFQLMNPAVWQHGRRPSGGKHRQQQVFQQLLNEPWVHAASTAQNWLPPGLAGVALRKASERQPLRGLESLAVLAIFVMGAGGALGLRLRGEFRGENLGAAPARKIAAAASGKSVSTRERSAGQERAWSLGASPSNFASPLIAVIEKEFRSLLRTLPLLYAVGAPLLLVLVISGSFLRGGINPHAPIFAFPLCVFFAQLGFHQLFGNNLGAEGAGIQLYFLSPTPMRTVILAKNLFHASIFTLAMVIAGFLATLRLGRPSVELLAITAAWLLFVLPCNLAAGNIFSLTMPSRINPGRISRQRRSQGSALLSLLLQAGLLGVGALVYVFSSMVGMTLLAIPIFLVLAGIAVFAWLRILGNVDDIASQRKDQLIATLMKAD